MWLWPDTLTGRALLVMLVGIVLSNGIGIVIFSGERLDLLISGRGHVLAERVSAAVGLMEDTAPEQRRRVIRRMRRPGVRMFWSLEPITEDETTNWQTRQIRGALISQLEDVTPDRLRLSLSPRPNFRGLPGTSHSNKQKYDREAPAKWHGGPETGDGSKEFLVGAYRLADGSWLNFATPFEAFRPFWMTRIFLAIVVTTLIVLVISIWAVRRATQPLSMFAGAAERLGVDVNAPALPEKGPREVRRASHAFNEMQERLQAFVRDRTQMLAAISHDLRTPITRLRLRAEFIEDGEQKEKILSDLDEIHTMISATLAFARDDFAEEQQKAFDLAVLLRNICDEKHDLGSDVTCEVPARMTFVGRPAALKRAFSNLIENAVTYGGGATVTLSADRETCLIGIEDRGPGLSESERERVFEPFYRVESSRSRETGGVGLGLAIARSIIRSHGGDISLANRPEGGLCVSVRLPIAKGGYGTPAPLVAPAPKDGDLDREKTQT